MVIGKNPPFFTYEQLFLAFVSIFRHVTGKNHRNFACDERIRRGKIRKFAEWRLISV